MTLVSKQTSLCLDPITHQQTHGWCYYEAVDDFSIIVEWIFLFVVAALTVWITRHFYRLLQYRRVLRFRELLGHVFIKIFFIVYIWSACCIIKASLNIAIYYQYMRDDFTHPNQNPYDDKDPPMSSPIVWLSSVFLVLDLLSTYSILLLVLFIPYRWLRKSLLNIKSKQQQISLETRIKINRYFLVLNYAKYYLKYVRLLYFLFFFIQPFLLFYTQIGCYTPRYVLFVIAGESFAILLFYVFGFKVLNDIKRQKLIPYMKKKDFNNIILQYSYLVFVMIVRIVLLILFRLQLFNFIVKDDPNHNCSDVHYIHKVQTTTYLSLCFSIMHILPIIVVVHIYRPDIQDANSNVMAGEKLLDSTREYNGIINTLQTKVDYGYEKRINDNQQGDNVDENKSNHDFGVNGSAQLDNEVQ